MPDADMPKWVVPEWKSFLESHSLPRGEADLQSLYSTNLYPLQRVSEIMRVASRLNLIRPETIMEIGTDKGGALYHWIQLLPSVKRVVAVEPRGTPYSKEFERAFPDIEFLWIESGSLDGIAVAKIKHFVGKTGIDFLFIDGDKSGFDKDFEAYWSLVNKGGIVAMHDVFDDGSPMQKAFKDCMSLGTDHEVIVDMSECDRTKSAIIAGANAHESGYAAWVRCWMYTSCGFGIIYK